MKNDRHLEVIERATSKPIKHESEFIYFFQNGVTLTESEVKEIGLNKLVEECGYVEDIMRKGGI